MDHIIRIGMDTSKHVFQLHGVNAAEEPVLRRKLRRNDMVVFFERLAPTIIAIEAAGASHHWARLLDLLRKSGEFPVSNEELDETATTVYEGF
jgi:transposase